ncbi:MAG: hypothetical protein D6690_08600 [Nitrospirae bacterium]|nr:MAG: hypothetical protein D6690_08600 [Nitrospirota bacterium]
MTALQSRLDDMQETLEHTRQALREAELINLAHGLSDDLTNEAKPVSRPGNALWTTDCFFRQTQRLLSVIAARPPSDPLSPSVAVQQESAILRMLGSSDNLLAQAPPSRIDRAFESAAQVCSDVKVKQLDSRINRLEWERAVVERVLASSSRLSEWVGEKWKEPRAALRDYQEHIQERTREFQKR